jgi:hypothetical protein
MRRGKDNGRKDIKRRRKREGNGVDKLCSRDGFI